MIKRMMISIFVALFAISCEDGGSSMTGPGIVDYGTRTIEIYSTAEQDENGYYHYPYTGYNYGSIFFNTDPMTLVGWTSPDEFCIQYFEELICEPVINFQTYAREDGTGQQNFYMSSESIGDTLTLIGYLNTDIYDEIKVIIK